LNFYFDESGDFSLPAVGTEKASTCAGLAVPDSSLQAFESEFRAWRQALIPAETRNGEPKGALLRRETRRLFFDHLDRVPHILTVPTILDLGIQGKLAPRDLKELSSAEGMRRAGQFEEKERLKIERLARQVARLGEPQLLRLHAMADCIELSLRHAMLFRSSGNLGNSWNRIRIRVDWTSPQPGSREEQVMRASLPVAIINRSVKKPFMLLEGAHGPDHPLTINFDSEEGLRMSKILEDLEFVDSRSDIGIQAADILANSLRLAASDLSNHNHDLEWYRRFMRHSCLGPNSNLGLILIGAGPTRRVRAAKYEIFQRILAGKRTAR
jgi:hypothetical protein